MPTCCFVPGCNSGYRSCKEKRHLFKVRDCFVAKWASKIPRKDRSLTSSCFICDIHFDERFIIKYFENIINGECVRIEREKWTLRDDAVPTNFPSLPKYFSKTLPRERTSPNKRKSLGNLSNAPKKPKPASETDLVQTTDETSDNIQDHNGCLSEPQLPVSLSQPTTDTPLPNEGDKIVCSQGSSSPIISTRTFYEQRERLYKLTSTVKTKNKKIQALKKQIKELKTELEEPNKDRIEDILAPLPRRGKNIVSHILKASKCKDKRGMRYSSEWILDCIILRINSSSQYEFLRKNGFLPLPDQTTLLKYASDVEAKLGFNNQDLFKCLKEKMSHPEKICNNE